MVAGRWTLLNRTAGPLLDEAAERGAAAVAAAPFNSGLLAQTEPSPDTTFDYGPAPAGRISAARELAEVASRAGVTLRQAALQFGLRHRAVATVVVGAASPEETRTDSALFGEPVPEHAGAVLNASRVADR